MLTGPPGAGKSTVARLLAEDAGPGALVEGDAFFHFLGPEAIEPWRPESHEQNTVVTTAAAAAAGAFTTGGLATIYDGVVGPWFLPTFGRASGLDRFDYAVLLPPVETCVERVLTRHGHGFRNEAAARKMHAEFAAARLAERHLLNELPPDALDVAALVAAAQSSGDLTYTVA